MIRPKTPRDVAEREALIRVASLAAQILITLRARGRGLYESERQLRQWLADDGIAHSAGDIRPALDLLESTGRISDPQRPRTPASWMARERSPEAF
jgi:hypothetical protein